MRYHQIMELSPELKVEIIRKVSDILKDNQGNDVAMV